MEPQKIDKFNFKNLQIIDIAEEGKGVAKFEDRVIFVEKAIPGDLVDARVVKKKRNFLEAVVTHLHTASPFRIEPNCDHFGTCGGCKWQNMSYDAQLRFKQQTVANQLKRLGKVDVDFMEPILASSQTEYYRNKLEFTFSNKRWLEAHDGFSDDLEMNALGFHVPGRFDKILAVDHCRLQADPSNAIRNAIRDYALNEGFTFYDLRNHEGNLRNLIIRTSSTGELMVVVIFAYIEQERIQQMMQFIQSEFPQITALLYVENQKKNDTIFDQEVVTFAGRSYIFEEMALPNDPSTILKFKIGAKSFYQTNSLQAYELYKITHEFADFKGDELVYDLYTGAGTIANFVSQSVRKVIGVEYVPSAIEDAKFNAELNKITNTEFFAGDMKDVLTSEFVAQHGKPDVILTDPPRAGMHPDVVKCLLEIAAPKIVYVSCNAATQARDLALLQDKYEVKRIRPVDMFPQTQHVENVVLLTLKSV